MDAVQPGVAPIVDHRPSPFSLLRKNKLTVAAGIIVATLVLVQVLFGRPPSASQPLAAPDQSVAPAAQASPETFDGLRDAIHRMTASSQAEAAATPTPGLEPDVRETRSGFGSETAKPAEDPMVADLKRRRYEARFGSNVVPPRGAQVQTGSSAYRAIGAQPAEDDAGAPPRPNLDAIAQAVTRAMGATPGVAPRADSTPTPARGTAAVDPNHPTFRSTAAAGLHRVSPGTTIETTLKNRLVIGGPVDCLVSVDVYAHDLTKVIPKGSKVIGEATPVQTTGESRLAVTFSTIVFPDGAELVIDKLSGMNQLGDVGLKDQVNHHFLSSLAAAGAVGLVTGFANYVGNGFGHEDSGVTVISGDVSNATSQATAQTLNRFLNRLPTITIREGHRVRVYLRTHLDLPEWGGGL